MPKLYRKREPTNLSLLPRTFIHVHKMYVCVYIYIYICVCVTHIHVYIYIYYLKIYDIPIKCWTTPYFQPCGNSVGTATSSGEEGTPLMPQCLEQQTMSSKKNCDLPNKNCDLTIKNCDLTIKNWFLTIKNCVIYPTTIVV